MYNDIAFQFNHEGPYGNLLPMVKLLMGGKRQVTGDISMQTEPSIEFTTTINTPIDIIRLVQATAKHEGSLSNLEVRRNLLDAALNTADVNFIDGSVNIKSPFDKFDNIIINLHHRNNAERLSTTGSVEGVSSKKIEIALNLEKGQRKDLTFTLSTPFSRDIRVVMSHEGSFSNKRLSADVFYDSKEQLHVETDLDSAEKTTGSMLIRVADVRVSFNHQSTKRNIVSHAELGYKDQNIVGDFTLKAGRKHEVSLKLQTPFSNFQNTRGAIVYTPSNPVKTVHAELFVLDELYQSDVILNTGNGLETSLTVKTPIRGYESTKIILNYQFGENRMQTHAELVYGNGQEFESDLILRLESPFEGTYILKTPFAGIENTKATFNYEFVNNRIQTHSEFIYGNQQRIESDVVLRVESPFEGSFTLRTPFVGHFEALSASFRHSGGSNCLNPMEKFPMVLRKKLKPICLIQKTTVGWINSDKTPFRGMEQRPSSFRSHAELVYGQQQKLEADVSLSNDRQLEGHMAVKTPFSGFEETSASFQHFFIDTNLKSSA
ncbi:hypothetical protein KUTeg_005892, partial [Tegillarca granosa]